MSHDHSVTYKLINCFVSTGTHPGSNAQKDSNLPPAGIGGIIALKLYFSFTTIVLLCCEVDLRENFQKDLEMA